MLDDAAGLCCVGCGLGFPVVQGVPILIDEANSLFSIEDLALGRTTTFLPVRPARWKLWVADRLPELTLNLRSAENQRRFLELLAQRTNTPRVLVIGAGFSEEILRHAPPGLSLEWVTSDVSFRASLSLVCDAHGLPFADGSFDGVVAQAVLEHVLDPFRCVDEIHRVLAPGGLVFAETPFMQQVHGGRYDFTRFTHLGHRRLFRRFEEIASGATVGPGSALAWSLQYFLWSFATSRRARSYLQLLLRLTAFWLKHLDRYVIDRPAALDAASGLFFIGRRAERALSDRELIQQYRGAIGQFVVPEIGR